MAERRDGVSERLIQKYLLGRVGQVVVSTDHVGDALFRIIGGDSQIVSGASVAPQNHEIVDGRILKSHLLVNRVLPDRLSLRNQKPDGVRLSALRSLLCLTSRQGLGPAPRKTAIGLIRFRHFPCLRQFLRRGEVTVRTARLQQRMCVGPMPIDSIALEYRTLIPVETQPAKSSQDGLGMLRLRAVAVRVLDTEDEHASVVASEQPIEERGAGTAHVKISRGRGSEPYSYRHVDAYLKYSVLMMFVTSRSVPGYTFGGSP